MPSHDEFPLRQKGSTASVATMSEDSKANESPENKTQADAAVPAEASTNGAAPVSESVAADNATAGEKAAATPTDKPVLVITAIASSGMRAADATMAHAKKLELVRELANGEPVSSVDFVELQISPAPFGALKNSLGVSSDTAALYDLLPLPDHLSPGVRRAAAQFVAAEKLWAFEGQGMLNGIPLNVRLDLPEGWDRTPKAIHDRLLAEGALNLSEKAVGVFNALQEKWNNAQQEARATSESQAEPPKAQATSEAVEPA